MEKAVCFTGHRDIAKEDLEKLKVDLENAIISLIEEGYTKFIAGGAIGFDALCEKTVLRLREKYPIILHIYASCPDHNKKFTPEQNKEFMDIINKADKIFCVSNHYFNGVYLMRNDAMLDASEVCISYMRKESGGTAYTVNKAKKLGKRLISL